MADMFTSEKRSEIMSRIKSKDTEPEILIRKYLHALGFRYRLHDRRLPGKPDLKLPKYNAIIQIHGCFWHGHDCHIFRPPKSNKGYWLPKIEKNRKRDSKNLRKLLNMGWRVLVVWECALKGKEKMNIEDLIQLIESWLISNINFREVSSKGLKDYS